ncbi:hemerythrin domain-containing protein [Rhodococcus sp. Z13]|uniref:Hemerythrin domain-containing protein n=1 Tax=Rhodococcus sacchari TaxID=2962047 RepID=A0ACD4DDV7_9NOCA|nr:hemerythrin domain-containing protein [Rhodococcus sp. Z13]UYP18233.1 hemerythrin domain-containing protein [Rhodococcus sp. Z13]
MDTTFKAAHLTTDDELLGMRLAHRVIRRDITRLADLADELRADPGRADRARCRAIADYTTLFTTSLHHHHNVEDFALWPLLTASVGPHVDLSALEDDHDRLDPLLDDLVRFAEALPDHDALVGFARTTHQLRDVLDEHLADEERTVFPLITGYVGADAWRRFEKEAQRGGRMDFDLTRVVMSMTPEETAAARTELPLPLRILLPVLTRRQRRRERAVFGSDA